QTMFMSRQNSLVTFVRRKRSREIMMAFQGRWQLTIGLFLGLALASPLAAASTQQAQLVDSYADLADLTLSAPIILQAEITKARVLRGDDAVGVPPDRVRM